MKSLEAVEPRTAIYGTSLPLNITSGGSYYMAENISFTTADTNAIVVGASNVTIDMNGFTLSGPGKTAGSSGNGIDIGLHKRVTVRNGNLENWRGYGIHSLASGTSLSGVTCEDNGSGGVSVGGSDSRLERCAFTNNEGNGVSFQSTASRCRVTECLSNGNTQSGFLIPTGSESNLVSHCHAIGNAFYGAWVYGTANIVEHTHVSRNHTGISCTSGSGNLFRANRASLNTSTPYYFNNGGPAVYGAIITATAGYTASNSEANWSY